jgi:hypothetical protein
VSDPESPTPSANDATVPHPIRDALDKAIRDTIAERRADARGTASLTASLQGVELKVTHQIRDGWEFGVWGAMDWHGKSEAGARIQGRW